MHLCFITHEYPKLGYAHGGIGSFVQTLARACVKNNIKVSVVGMGYTDITEIESDQGVSVYRVGRSNAKYGGFIFNSFKLNAIIKKIHKEYPLSIIEGAELDFAFITKIKNVHYTIRMHGGHHFFSKTLGKTINKWRGFKEKLSFKRADSFIAVTNFVGNKTAELLKKTIPFKCIYNFVDTQLFSPNPAINTQKFKLVFVGTVCEKKGIRQLLLALPKIKEKFPKVHLEVIGRDWLYPKGDSYIGYLKKNIDTQVFDSVTFRGAIPFDQIPEHLATAHVAVFPSHMESFGLTLIEAMAMEKPILASDIPPFKEIAGVNQENVVLCNPHSEKEISENICLLFEDEKKAAIRAKLAAKRIAKLFEKDIIVQQNIAYYKNIELAKK